MGKPDPQWSAWSLGLESFISFSSFSDSQAGRCGLNNYMCNNNIQKKRRYLNVDRSLWLSGRFSFKREEVSYLKRANPFFLVFFSVSSTDSSVFFFPLLFLSFFFPLVFFFPSSASRSWREELLAGVSWPELCSDRSSSVESEHRDGGRHWPQQME